MGVNEMNAEQIILDEIRIQYDLMNKHFEPYDKKLKSGKLTTDELLQSGKEAVMYKHTINALNKILVKIKNPKMDYAENSYDFFKYLALDLLNQHRETIQYSHDYKVGYQEIIRLFDLLPNTLTYCGKHNPSSPNSVIEAIQKRYEDIPDLKYILFGNHKQMGKILTCEFSGKDFGTWEYMNLDFVELKNDNIEPHLIVYKYEDGVAKYKACQKFGTLVQL